MKAPVPLLAALLVSACSMLDRMGPGAPDVPEKPSHTMICNNPLDPAAFQIRMADERLLPRIVNHYITPLTNRDSIRVGLNDGRTAWLTEVFADDHCVTALDSAIRHTANTAGYIVVP